MCQVKMSDPNQSDLALSWHRGYLRQNESLYKNDIAVTSPINQSHRRFVFCKKGQIRSYFCTKFPSYQITDKESLLKIGIDYMMVSFLKMAHTYFHV